MLIHPSDQFARIETTCGLLLRQLQEIWSEMGEPDDERDAALVEIEQECLAVYRRKVEEASRCKSDLLKAIAIGRAEIAAIGSSMGGIDVQSNNRVGENLKEELHNVNIQLEEMRKKKMERKKQFDEVLDQLHKITFQLGRPTDFLNKLTADEMDLSHQKLEESHRELVELQKEKGKRLEEVEGYLDMLNLLCSVLGKDFEGLISEIHPSLVGSETKDVSKSTLDRLARTIESLHEDKIQRIQTLQELSISLLELWNLLNTPMEEQKIFYSITSIIAASESEITETSVLSITSIKRVEDEVMRLSKLKTVKIKELILRKKVELEEISRKMHMAPEVLKSAEYSTESLESGVSDPEYLLEQIDCQITKIKEEALSRKEILERVEKWTAACEEESWLEEYNRDENRYNAGRGSYLTLKHAEKARILVNKLPGMVEALIVKVTAWEIERGVEFLYDGVRLLSMLEQYNTLRREKELEKQRQRDLKKLRGQLIAEQETLYGSRRSPTTSGKKALRTPGPSISRKLSLGGAVLQTLKPEKATPRGLTTRKGSFMDQNSTSKQLRSGALQAPSGRRNSEIPGRLAKKHVCVAGKVPETRAPMVRKPLSPIPSNILNSPEEHREACSRSLETTIVTPTKFVNPWDEENNRTPSKRAPISVPSTPATSVAMTMAATPATPVFVASSFKTLENRIEDVEFSFEEVRAGFTTALMKPMFQA